MIYVDRDKCDGCGLCVEVCPHSALKLVDGAVEVAGGHHPLGQVVAAGEVRQPVGDRQAAEAEVGLEELAREFPADRLRLVIHPIPHARAIVLGQVTGTDQENRVLCEFSPGFRLEDRVVRAAKVQVGKR